MRKITLCFILPLCVALAGCSKDEEKGLSYSEQQKKVLNVFKGTFRFDNKLGDYVAWSEIIEFTEQYNEPRIFTRDDYMNGEVFDGEVHGKCFFTSSLGDRESKFYYVGTDGDFIILYADKSGKIGNGETNLLKVNSAESFTLRDPDLSYLSTSYFLKVK